MGISGMSLRSDSMGDSVQGGRLRLAHEDPPVCAPGQHNYTKPSGCCSLCGLHSADEGHAGRFE